MKFTSALSALLLASTAVAAPADFAAKLKERRHERLAKRVANSRSIRPLAVNATSLEDFIEIDRPREVTYSSNWAGAVIRSSRITEVTGTFTIPTVRLPSGSNSQTTYGASAWVGIDGNTCTSGLSTLAIICFME